MSNVFDILTSINQTKKNLLKEGVPSKEYIPFIINRSLSYFPDTIMHSNEMNIRPMIPKIVQYEYLLCSTRTRKRFSKWFKKDKNNDIEVIREFYNISTTKAQEYYKILTKKQLLKIKEILYKGGVD